MQVLMVKTIALPDGSGTLIGFIVNHSDEVDQLVAITVGGQRADFLSDVQLLKNKPMIFEGDSANAKAKIAALGLKPGNLVVISGKYKSGKTRFSLSLLRDFAVFGKIPVGLVVS